MIDFSICIPTHNRADLLPTLFANLAKQHGAAFEAVVVDDGSTDGTAAALANLATSALFPVVVRNIANAGRGTALNHAFDAASGRFIFIMDDDDLMPPGTLADVLAVWNSIPADIRDGFCGVCGLCANPAGKTIGQRFTGDMMDSDFFSIRILQGVRGDKREVVLRSAIGDFRFPTIADEKRVATNMLWFDLARHYRTRFVNHVWLTKDYRPDGISASGLRQKVTSPRLTQDYYRRTLTSFPAMPPTVRLRFMVNYLRFAAHGGQPFSASIAAINHKATALIALPLARLVAWNDRARLRKGAKRRDQRSTE